MTTLLRLLLSWSVRRLLMFVLIVIAMVAFVKVKEAYDRLPAAHAEISSLQAQQHLLQASVREQRAQAQASIAQIGALEAPLLRQRLANVRLQLADPGQRRLTAPGFALAAVRGDADALARDLAASFRLQLLQREEALIRARLGMIANGNRVAGLSGRIRQLDARISELEMHIAAIERRHPVLSRIQRIPLIGNLRGPLRELRTARRELEAARQQRAQLHQARQAVQASLGRADAAYRATAAAIREAAAPDDLLERTIRGKQEDLSRHWANRAWDAVRPVLGWALLVTLLVIAGPPAIKAFWFFVVAPATARLDPVRIRPELKGDIAWAGERTAGAAERPGSAVSHSLLVRPGEELLVRPDYLQSSMNDARIDSQLLLSWEIPLGSLAAGLIGLTRIRVDREATATLSATQDMLDEVGIIDIPDGSALVFQPRNLVGVLQRADRPMRIDRVWMLGHLSSWLTLRLRHLVFRGPCALVVKGARGIALEPAASGRRIAGAATMGWSTGLAWSVRRSETFLAYLTGGQSLFNDSFEGAPGKVVYEEMPRAGGRGGLFGRGLEGIGDAMLKIVGL